jgi:hypothetical protein
MIMIGHPKPVERAVNPNAPKGVTARDLTSWEVFGNRDPN